MKKITTVDTSRLSNLETVQLVKEHLLDVANLEITDAPTQKFITDLTAQSAEFEAYIENERNSEFSKAIREYDMEREKGLSAFGRALKVHALSANPAEQAAYNRLNSVWNIHKKLVKANDKQQTSGIDNLTADLDNDAARESLNTLFMGGILQRINQANNAYKTELAKRNDEQAERIFYESKRLRSQLLNTYKLYGNYIQSMTNLYSDSELFGKIFSLLNVTRKKFADLAKRRKKSSPEETGEG